jgi:hypothetical protein
VSAAPTPAAAPIADFAQVRFDRALADLQLHDPRARVALDAERGLAIGADVTVPMPMPAAARALPREPTSAAAASVLFLDQFGALFGVAGLACTRAALRVPDGLDDLVHLRGDAPPRVASCSSTCAPTATSCGTCAWSAEHGRIAHGIHAGCSTDTQRRPRRLRRQRSRRGQRAGARRPRAGGGRQSAGPTTAIDAAVRVRPHAAFATLHDDPRRDALTATRSQRRAHPSTNCARGTHGNQHDAGRTVYGSVRFVPRAGRRADGADAVVDGAARPGRAWASARTGR